MTRHVPIGALLALHERHRAATPLYENLGDGALYAGNPVYRAVRDAAVAAGCTFTTDDPDGYFAWPLVSLPRLLKTRRLPYRKSRAAFAALDASRPGFFKTSDAELIEPQSNAVLHEAAHCIADRLWDDAAPHCAGLSAMHKTVLKFTVGEAFANACELSAMAHVPTPEEQWLLAYNSYWAHLPVLPQAWKRIGDGAARWLILCFMASNLCRSSLSAPMRKAFLELAGVQDRAKPVREALDYLAEEAFSLNLIFRQSTAKVFYASLGLDPNVKKLTGFDPLGPLSADPALRGLLDRLGSLLN